MRIQGGIPVGGNLGFYSPPGYRTLEYVPGRDDATPKTMEWDYERDGTSLGISPIGTAPLVPGEGSELAQRVYGPIEQGLYNRPGPTGEGIVQPEVYMAPYPGRGGEIKEYFPLGNPRAGYRFEANLPGAPGNIDGMQLAQTQAGGFNFLNPMSWFQGKPQRAIQDADRGIAPAKGSGSLAEQLLRRRAEQSEAMKMLRQ
jgi:hypothetical protein